MGLWMADENKESSGKFLSYLPWAIIGILVVMGGITVAAAGLPWQTKTEAALVQKLTDMRIEAVATLQQTNATQIGQLTAQVSQLTGQNARLQQQLDDYLKDQRHARIRSLEHRVYADKRAEKYAEQHRENEVRALEHFAARQAIGGR